MKPTAKNFVIIFIFIIMLLALLPMVLPRKRDDRAGRMTVGQWFW